MFYVYLVLESFLPMQFARIIFSAKLASYMKVCFLDNYFFILQYFPTWSEYPLAHMICSILVEMQLTYPMAPPTNTNRIRKALIRKKNSKLK